MLAVDEPAPRTVSDGPRQAQGGKPPPLDP